MFNPDYLQKGSSLLLILLFTSVVHNPSFSSPRPSGAQWFSYEVLTWFMALSKKQNWMVLQCPGKKMVFFSTFSSLLLFLFFLVFKYMTNVALTGFANSHDLSVASEWIHCHLEKKKYCYHNKKSECAFLKMLWSCCTAQLFFPASWGAQGSTGRASTH